MQTQGYALNASETHTKIYISEISQFFQEDLNKKSLKIFDTKNPTFSIAE